MTACIVGTRSRGRGAWMLGGGPQRCWKGSPGRDVAHLGASAKPRAVPTTYPGTDLTLTYAIKAPINPE